MTLSYFLTFRLLMSYILVWLVGLRSSMGHMGPPGHSLPKLGPKTRLLLGSDFKPENCGRVKSARPRFQLVSCKWLRNLNTRDRISFHLALSSVSGVSPSNSLAPSSANNIKTKHGNRASVNAESGVSPVSVCNLYILVYSISSTF